jgi:protein Tex
VLPAGVTADLAARIAREVQIPPAAVSVIVRLLDEGCTAPFIARYRKEATGGTDDAAILRTQERLEFHRELLDRKQTILETIGGQGALTPELRAAIERAETRLELEDLYLPYRPKRRTRATMAREKGLEPLADRMIAQRDQRGTPADLAAPFVDSERGVATVEEALQGARDIVAERVTEAAACRARIRDLTWRKGLVHAQASRGKAGLKSNFSDYYDYHGPVARIPSHRVLAIFRGETEGFLSVHIQPDPEEAMEALRRLVLDPRGSIWTGDVRRAVDDAYTRLLSLQIATEARVELKARADREAIEVFARGLRDLLMAPPFGGRPVLAVDPGHRTGCKVAVLGPTGQLLDSGVIYPTEPKRDVKGTEAALDRWFRRFPDLAAIAVGSGTGGRETFGVIRAFLDGRRLQAVGVLVSEAGASVYSASEVGREEFPDHDVTVRGAASIGRRLQDPLAELVKIDPKSIGVRQYQHDVDPALLKQKLHEVVVSCVNRVGVDLATASPSLLRYVSGLSARLAKEIVAWRDAQGGFRNRAQLLEVPGLGKKTFEQAAGFLRIRGDHPLDNSAVHPERYALVERIAHDQGRPLRELIGDRTAVGAIELSRYVDDAIGLLTLSDIARELEKPGRDPRADFEVVEYQEGINKIEDLRPDLVLNGTVTNLTSFGAFVDIGVHQDGLVHVSRISPRFIRDPGEVLHVGQTVKVRVVEVDLERGRIGLSIRDA